MITDKLIRHWKPYCNVLDTSYKIVVCALAALAVCLSFLVPHKDYFIILVCVCLTLTGTQTLSRILYLRICLSFVNVFFILWAIFPSYPRISWDIIVWNTAILMQNIKSLYLTYQPFPPHFETLYLKLFEPYVSRSQFAKMVQIGYIERFKRNAEIIHKSQKLTKLRYLVKGMVRINNGSQLMDSSIESVYKDEFVDSIQWILFNLSPDDSCTYDVSARTMTHCTCISWSRDLLIDLLAADQGLADALRKALCDSVAMQSVRAKIKTQKYLAYRQKIQRLRDVVEEPQDISTEITDNIFQDIDDVLADADMSGEEEYDPVMLNVPWAKQLTEPLETTVPLRSSTYLVDGKKQVGKPSVFRLAYAECFKSDTMMEHFAKHSSSWFNMNDKASFTLIIHLHITSLNISFITYHTVDENHMAGLNGNGTPIIRGDEAMTNVLDLVLNCKDIKVIENRLKLIPRVVSGPFLVKRMVENRSIVLGQKASLKYFRGRNYFEIDAIIENTKIGAICNRFAKKIVIDMTWAIQAEKEEELPERMLCGVTVHNMDFGQCTPLENDIK